jgi:hypothetical protein
MASWDGKDDAGQPVAAGRYRVRGYLVGDGLRAEGVAYHFNDWIDDEKSPRITRIEDFRRQPGGFVVFAEVLDGRQPVVFRFDQLRGFLWTNHLDATPPGFTANDSPSGHGFGAKPSLGEFSRVAGLFLPGSGRMLATTDHYVAALLGGSIYLLNMDDGTTIATQPERFPHAACMDASADALFIGFGASVARIALPDLGPAREEKTPLGFDALAARGEQMLGSSFNAWQVWASTDAEWKKLPLTVAASSLSFGLEGTFWMTAKETENGKLFTGQFDKNGEFLRAYRDEFSPIKVCASTTVEEIAVLEMQGTTQRLRVLSLVGNSLDTPGDWAVGFEKTIRDCRRFGIVDGKLVPDAGNTPQIDQVDVALATGGLTTSSHKLTLRVTSDQTGLWLETRSGLRLAFLTSQSNVRRVVLLLAPGKEFLTVYAGDGAVVAEYAVRGLGNIVEIDAGEVELR